MYLTDDATGSMRVIDIRDPLQPREVARWQTEQVTEGRYLHDIAVTDGIAYLTYWDDGLVVLDVGNGMKGGSPENPKFVSQFKYDLDELYARVDEYWGLSARGTHTAWRAGKYVFIGDEVYASRPSTGLKDGNDLTFGRLQVLDVSNLEKPKLVAWYEPTDGGVHNIWVAGDTLYMGNYQGGARAVDISGELKGDLLRQGREIGLDLHGRRQGRQAAGHVRLGCGGEGRDHLRAGHQHRAVDPAAGAEGGADAVGAGQRGRQAGQETNDPPGMSPGGRCHFARPIRSACSRYSRRIRPSGRGPCRSRCRRVPEAPVSSNEPVDDQPAAVAALMSTVEGPRSLIRGAREVDGILVVLIDGGAEHDVPGDDQAERAVDFGVIR